VINIIIRNSWAGCC